MIKPFLSTAFILSRARLLNFRLIFKFSQESQTAQNTKSTIRDLSKAQNFYRNSIRKININESGKGKFTEHHLIRLTKLTSEQSQIPLLFEGYFNYLGHLTPISNRTVDKMLLKVMSFKEVPFDRIFEVLHNHIYFAYFPSYQVILQLLNCLQDNDQNLEKFIRILQISPLIKLNREIIDKMLEMSRRNQVNLKNSKALLKIIIKRKGDNLLKSQINSIELFESLVQMTEQALKDRRNISLKYSNQVQDLISQIKQKASQIQNFHEKMAMFGILVNKSELFAQSIVKIEDKSNIQNIFRILLQLNTPRSFIMLLAIEPTQSFKTNESYLNFLQLRRIAKQNKSERRKSKEQNEESEKEDQNNKA